MLDRYVTIGRSGLRVSPLCLGTMTCGEDWGWVASEAESARMLDRYLDLGGNFVYTANFYTHGHSEKILGDLIGANPARRRRTVLATKFFSNLYTGDPNGGGAGRKSIVDACEQSLRRLRTGYIDLYWLHCWDRFTPIEETMRALDDLVYRDNPPPMKSGKPAGPAVHLGPYRTFFNRDVTVTLPYDAAASGRQAVKVYIYNHLTEDWDPVPFESADADSGSVTFKTKVLGLFQVATDLCAIEQLYGKDSEEVRLLRDFRDRVLRRVPAGEAMTRLYYEWSPSIASAMKEDAGFKTGMKVIIDGMLPLMGKVTE